MNIFEQTKSIKKSIRLHRISRDLSSYKQLSLSNLSKRNNALKKLYEISIKDETVSSVISKYNLNQDNYKKLYWDLIKNGAGQYNADHFVAASTMVYAQTLSFCLEYWTPNQGFQIDGKNNQINSSIIVSKLINWFENEECGFINLND